MVRYRGQKALYEVIKESSLKSSAPKEQVQEKKQIVQNHAQDSVKQQELPGQMKKWPRKPKMIRLDAERVEISIPYHLAVAGILVIVLFVMLSFRLGQRSGKNTALSTVGEVPISAEKVEINDSLSNKPVGNTADIVQERPFENTTVLNEQDGKDNRIVIATHLNGRELEPVRDYFNRNGIQTEIRKIESRYYLVTKEKCDGNFSDKNSNGYILLQKVRKTGLGYNAPKTGLGNFGPRPFQDAYGKKFDD